MALLKSRSVNGRNAYREKGRYKVGAVVWLNGVTYQNVTGANSNPIDGIDWIAYGSGESTGTPYDVRFDYVDSSTFIVPENLKITGVEKNDFTTLNYNKVGTNLLISEPLEVGDWVNVHGLVVEGNVSNNNNEGCITAECVQNMPTFDNDNEAVSLPSYTPYKTSTGQLRYKLPTTDPTGFWNDEEIWVDTETWID